MIRLFLFVSLVTVSLLPSCRAAAAPRIFFERGVMLEDLSFQAVAANSRGDYYVLNSLEGTVIKLDNDLNEVLRFPIPAADYSRYNEISVDTADRVWISQGRFTDEKPFLSFDGNGNHLGGFIFEDRNNTSSSNNGIVFDSEGNVHFIANRFVGGQLSCWLVKVDPATGMRVTEWPVSTDGPFYWHRGLVIDGSGNFLWGNFSSRNIYEFDPVSEEQTLFGSLPSWSATHAVGLGDDGTLYALEDPTYGHALYVFDEDGAYRGARQLDFEGHGAGMATYEDEVLVVSVDGIVVKYTSLCEASAEYPYCVWTVGGMIGLVDLYVSTGDINRHTGAKLSRDLDRVGRAVDAGDTSRAIHQMEQFKHFVRIKTGKGISPEASEVLLLTADNTINSLL
jgi:streptogramin lyase